MAIPSSGAISLLDIQNEFGGSSPISLNEYYAGGSYVPSGTTGTYGAVPSSGEISLRNFYGTSKVVNIYRTITVGINGSGPISLFGYGSSAAPVGAYGSIDNQNFGLINTNIVELCFVEGSPSSVILRLDGNQSNSGFSAITVGNNTYFRSSATYNAGSQTYWLWSAPINPFSSVGTTTAVIFTS